MLCLWNLMLIFCWFFQFFLKFGFFVVIFELKSLDILFFTSSCQTLLLSSFQSLHLHLFWWMTLTSFCQRHQVKHVRPFFLPEEYKCERKTSSLPLNAGNHVIVCVSVCLLAKYLETNLMDFNEMLNNFLVLHLQLNVSESTWFKMATTV